MWRRAGAAEIALVSKTGERRDIALEPLLCFRMKGIGYSHPEWGHGRWKGELAIGGESWREADLDPLYDPVERGEALVDVQTPPLNIKFGVNYTSVPY